MQRDVVGSVLALWGWPGSTPPALELGTSKGWGVQGALTELWGLGQHPLDLFGSL